MSPGNLRLSLIAVSALVVASDGFYCSLLPCFYLQPPHPGAKQTLHSEPSRPYYPPSYSVYQRPIPVFPIIIYVTKVSDQASSGSGYAPAQPSSGDSGYVLYKPGSQNPAAVQVLSPSTAPPTTATASDRNPTVGLSSVLSGSESSAPTSIPTFPTTPASSPSVDLAPVDLTNSSGRSILIPSSTNVHDNTNHVKPSGNIRLESSAYSSGNIDGVAPTRTSSRHWRTWWDKWLQPVTTWTHPKLCQTNHPTGQFTDDTHRQCVAACEAAFRGKLDSVGEAAYSGKLDSTGEAAYSGKLDSVGEAAFSGKLDSVGEAAFSGKLDSIGEAAYSGKLDSTGEAAYSGKLDGIGWADTRALFLNGSCHSEARGRRDVCMCNVQLGMRYESFPLISEE